MEGVTIKHQCLESHLSSTVVSIMNVTKAFILVSRCLSHSLFPDVDFVWDSSIRPGKRLRPVLQPRSNKCVESSADTAG